MKKEITTQQQKEATEKAIRKAVFSLLPAQMERFTMGTSSSLPTEIGESLFHSLVFVLAYEIEKKEGGVFPQDTDNVTLLKKAEITVKEGIKRTEYLCGKVKSTTPPIENISYCDTLKALFAFPQAYDYRFFAHEIPCTFDYQLCNAIDDSLEGVSYVEAYLTTLLWENTFCDYFPADLEKRLLVAYCRDYRGLLINIFAPIATNSMGLVLLRKDPRLLHISHGDCKELERILLSKTPRERKALLRESADILCDVLGICQIPLKEYLEKTAENLLPRLEAALEHHSLNGIFLSFLKAPQPKKEEAIFIDNAPMEDKYLRELMDKITDQEEIGEKIRLVHTESHSFSDLLELLNLCFWEEDAMALLASLDETTLELLKKEAGSPHHVASESHWEMYL